MDDHTIQLVRESFDLVEPIAPQAAEYFYTELFAADPSLRTLFRGDMALQGAKLMKMMSFAVAHLQEPQVLMPALRHLGQQHAEYGVRDDDYDTVGGALLRTLAFGTGVAFTPDVEAAWIDVYGTLAGTMKEAARQPA